MNQSNNLNWLLFFYTIPANPVNNRMKIWRKLVKTGAVQLKGGVYILPYSEERHEALQWLLAELPGLKGEGLLLRTDSIEPLQQHEIIAFFDGQRRQQYQELAGRVDEFTGRLSNVQKGGADRKQTSLFRQYDRLAADLLAIRQRDFFDSETGRELSERLAALRRSMEELNTAGRRNGDRQPATLLNGRNIADFTGLTWLTRRRPFVDRMASAWLIRRFIDPGAAFAFRDEEGLAQTRGEREVSFDVRQGDFTHVDDLCTFEVLVQSFGLADRGLSRLAGIVHDIDIKDGKFAAAEAPTVEMIIRGIRNRDLPDEEALEQGMAVFEALYLSLSEHI
ncbi:MAG: chromate resistance protein [Leptonema illini]|uniref:Chromate resistance protein n=1 Tax=Leptonema illini TaxID=183 RepID=A0A833GVT7_9LEPT|nr:MAG: chromate resistance protein [Leptonema illini]